jgi:hypothetical protein
MTFEEMCKARDPLYAATRSHTPFLQALTADREAEECKRIGGLSGIATIKERERDVWLLKLTVRALRNQRQPYYDAR